MSRPPLPPRHREALEVLCMVIRREKTFRQWYRGLVACPSNLRISALLQMIGEMRRNQEEDTLIDAVAALCDEDLFKLVQEAVIELGVFED